MSGPRLAGGWRHSLWLCVHNDSSCEPPNTGQDIEKTRSQSLRNLSNHRDSSFFTDSNLGHLCRDHGCQITKTVEGYMEGRRRRGMSRKQHMDNIKQ